jgi:uncharacterized membrane protein
MSPRVRRLAVTAHVTVSVGWVGAVITLIGIAVVGLTADDEGSVRGAYLVMEAAARYVLVPLALRSLVTGFVQSLGTTWGLLRHHWVVVKLLITVVATAVLLLYLRTFAVMADAAADPAAALDEVRNPSPLVHALLALVLLLVATVLGVVKPRGLTRIGRRSAARRAVRSQPAATG